MLKANCPQHSTNKEILSDSGLTDSSHGDIDISVSAVLFKAMAPGLSPTALLL